MTMKCLTDKHGSGLGFVGAVVQFVNKFPDNLHLSPILLAGWIHTVVLAHENEISFNDH